MISLNVINGIRALRFWVVTLAQTRYQAAMEEALKALMEEQKRSLQQQILE